MERNYNNAKCNNEMEKKLVSCNCSDMCNEFIFVSTFMYIYKLKVLFTIQKVRILINQF